MNRPTFDHTVSVLVKAYLNDTLRSGSCYACAVGNIIAASNGWEHNKMDSDLCWVGHYSMYKGVGREEMWTSVFYTSFDGEQFVREYNYIGQAKRLIESTGYHWTELAQIEKAFESEYHGDDPMFNSLMSVIDTLAEIHNIDLSQKEQAKLLFCEVTILTRSKNEL